MAGSTEHLRLANFIRLNVEPIVVEWIDFARTRTPASDSMTKLAVRNHIEEILTSSPTIWNVPVETRPGQKIPRPWPEDSQVTQSAAEVHATLRLRDGFDIGQMVQNIEPCAQALLNSGLRTIKCWAQPISKTVPDLMRQSIKR